MTLRTGLIWCTFLTLVLLCSYFVVQQRHAGAVVVSPVLPNQSTPTYDDVIVTLRRVGLTPEHLAAAGVNGNQAQGVIVNMAAALVTSLSELEEVSLVEAQARAQRDALRRQIQAGLADEGDVQAYDVAQSDHASASSQRQALLDQLYESAVANLNDSQRTTVLTLISNSHWRLPTPYLVLNQTEPQWVALRDALAHVRIRTETGESPDPEPLQLKLDADSTPAVATAKVNYEALLFQVESAFDGT